MSRGKSGPRGGYSSNVSNVFHFSRFFEATIKVFNGASGDDLRLETGLRRGWLTTPPRRQRDGETANYIPISLTRILSSLRMVHGLNVV